MVARERRFPSASCSVPAMIATRQLCESTCGRQWAVGLSARLIFFAISIGSSTALAAGPEARSFMPAGGQRGGTIEVAVAGQLSQVARIGLGRSAGADGHLRQRKGQAVDCNRGRRAGRLVLDSPVRLPGRRGPTSVYRGHAGRAHGTRAQQQPTQSAARVSAGGRDQRPIGHQRRRGRVFVRSAERSNRGGLARGPRNARLAHG